ncbi:Hypothetical protein NTJ_09798 [Nesidiocoris tenuis]|uniref:Uncharacterized protein n=1 Tax=Nesidiocoris tenuis TaxID=355587 RepID=A0ABN7AXS2_9HEMI|nr:Hypothetical protein NTJ_09798 [Nesidiocoris tenuis]
MISSTLLQSAVFLLISKISASDVQAPEAFTNLTHAYASTGTGDAVASVASQGGLNGIELGSSGAQATDDVGAATSYGLSSTKASQTILGVGAAGTKSSGAISAVHNSAIGTTNQQMSMVQRIKRDDTNANTDLQAVSGDNSEGNMGSTGVQAGPVATSISLGALLLDGGNSYSTVNAGSAAAHAGDSDATYTFSNSDLAVDNKSK